MGYTQRSDEFFSNESHIRVTSDYEASSGI
jgi:hypothetical protein